jgi:HK97 family phage portal protein
MLHLRWFTPPQSLVGISPLNQTRNLVGLAIAMDRHLAQFYGEGGTPSSVLETDQKLTLDQARVIQGTWEATHRRHRKPAVLSDGLKWRPITTSAADQQMIQTREQLIRDIARVFRIPSHLIMASGDNQTYQNVEQASLNFLTHTIAPWLRRIEIAMSKILDPGVDVAFDTSVLLRVDALTRAKVNELNIKMGARTPNEVRQIEGMEPYDGGDTFNQALQGNVLAGGQLPSLGTDDDPSAPMMGVLE